MPAAKRVVVHIPQLQLTVFFSRAITPSELLTVISELRGDIQSAHPTKPPHRP